jgi:hypothetical protein
MRATTTTLVVLLCAAFAVQRAAAAILNVNEPPALVVPAVLALTIPEDKFKVGDDEGSTVLTLVATDVDSPSEDITFSLADDGGGRFKIPVGSKNLVVAKQLDYESDVSHSIEVHAFDKFSTTETKLTITVTDVNEPPRTVTLSGTNSVIECDTTDCSAISGTVVGTLSSVDPDNKKTTHQTLTYHMDANDYFEIVGDKVKVKAGLGGANPKYISYEIDKQLSLRNLYAQDNGDPVEQSTPLTIVLDVVDIDEFNVPAATATANASDVNEKPTMRQYVRSVPEKKPEDTLTPAASSTSTPCSTTSGHGCSPRRLRAFGRKQGAVVALHGALGKATKEGVPLVLPTGNKFKGEDLSARNAQQPVTRSSAESYGFFTDVQLADWCRLKQRAQTTPNHVGVFGHGPVGLRYRPAKGRVWYQENWEPIFTCQGEERQGLGDGPKWLCDPYKLKSPSGHCVVYSIGSNNDFYFEQAIVERIGSHCEVHTFDHTSEPGGPQPQNFHRWGLAAQDSADGKLKTLATIVKTLGHKRVDVFKIDCELCEWKTFHQWFEHLQPTQVLVELHYGTEGASPVPAEKFMLYMRSKGYAVFHKEPNTLGCDGDCIEYAFIRLAPTFWSSTC